MDLSFVKEQLETFSTFAGAIGDFLQKPAEILQLVFGWLGDGYVVGEGEEAVTHTIDSDLELTSSLLGSSKDSE